MRPVGEIARAMRDAAEVGPGTVRDLAGRAQVGYGLARCTATRLVQRGELVVVSDERPMVLAVPPAGEELGQALCELHRSFWESALAERPAAPATGCGAGGSVPPVQPLQGAHGHPHAD